MGRQDRSKPSASDAAGAARAAVRAPSLKPLLCAACSGPVPLLDGEVTKCPYCGQPVTIPPDYRELRDADRQRSGDEGALAAIYARIGRPPGLLLRMWGSVVGQVVMVLIKVLGVLGWIWVGLFAIVLKLVDAIDDIRVVLAVLALPFGFVFLIVWGLARALHAMSPALGIDLIDVYSLPVAFAWVGVAIYVTTAVPLALLRAAEAYAMVRQRLQACLAARPPSSDGGPATCRQCGGALVIPNGALGVRCVYCHTDNLVALPERWITQVKDRTATFHHQVESALAEELASRKKSRFRMWGILIGSLALPFVLWGLGHAMTYFQLVENQEGWQRAVAASSGVRAFTPHHCAVLDPCSGIDPDKWDVALRKNESVDLVGPATADSQEIRVRLMDNNRIVKLHDEIKDHEFRARFVSPISGWLVVEGPKTGAEWSAHVVK